MKRCFETSFEQQYGVTSKSRQDEIAELKEQVKRWQEKYTLLLMESRRDLDDAEKVLKETVGRMVGRRLVGRLNHAVELEGE